MAIILHILSTGDIRPVIAFNSVDAMAMVTTTPTQTLMSKGVNRLDVSYVRSVGDVYVMASTM